MSHFESDQRGFDDAIMPNFGSKKKRAKKTKKTKDLEDKLLDLNLETTTTDEEEEELEAKKARRKQKKLSEKKKRKTPKEAEEKTSYRPPYEWLDDNEEDGDDDVVDEPARDVQRQPLAGAAAVGVHGDVKVHARAIQRARRDEKGEGRPRARREPRGVPLRIERAPEDRAVAHPVQHAEDDRVPDVARAGGPFPRGVEAGSADGVLHLACMDRRMDGSKDGWMDAWGHTHAQVGIDIRHEMRPSTE